MAGASDAVEKFNNYAGKYWHDFYRHNGTRFFRDRHYLDIVFEELNQVKKAHETQHDQQRPVLLEVGCGVGNAFFPLCEKVPNLEVYACDFAKSAIEIILVLSAPSAHR